MVFRPASKNDACAIAALHAKSWQQNYRGALSDAFLDEKAPSERLAVWRSRLENSPSEQCVLVAENGGKVVGFVCLYFDHSSEYGTLLDNLHVSSEMQGNGIGRQLMRLAAEKMERRRPDSSMYLWVLQQNLAAIRFYEALGGLKVEAVEEMDIGDIPVIKSRYYWNSLSPLLQIE
ncbi:GNAT family N-acetyltransferase [Aggregatimonas sangjinii]|uniref:GNAT family N-acetyltransferase n=1 Tax=Aggregatimonas sangjinii TaxID=2583587 RepID=A0A5B7SVH8_9FLAO|nr:GNAT family N-acetyltransferase [Aggregatimonas sangjinii]QCX01299.1 GNAT family N-acetyltransferase [Aggregatimonas sangjinii]